jgi:hypothetical protein
VGSGVAFEGNESRGVGGDTVSLLAPDKRSLAKLPTPILIPDWQLEKLRIGNQKEYECLWLIELITWPAIDVVASNAMRRR